MTKALDESLKALQKKFGDDSVSVIGEKTVAKVESIPTGCLSLDYVLGCGGIPRGRIVEIYGEESSGKSTLAMFFTAVMQKTGGTALWIDSEQTFSQDYASDLGMDVSKLVLNQPACGEDGLEIVRKLAEDNVIDLAVVDSVAALTPRREIEGDIEKEEMALQARMMSKALRVIVPLVAKSRMALIFINQTREKVGMVWGSRESTPGGKSLKFNASIRLKVRKKDLLKDKDGTIIGNVMYIKAEKNKVGMPFRECEIEVYYGKGIDFASDLLEAGIRTKVIERAGAVYKYKGETLGSGKDAAKEFLRANKEKYDIILNEVKNYGNSKDRPESKNGESKKNKNNNDSDGKSG